MFDGMTQDEVIQALATVPAADLPVLKLLRKRQPQHGSLFPTGLTREEYTEATRDMLEYTRTCADLAQRLRALPSIPAPNDDLMQLAGYVL